MEGEGEPLRFRGKIISKDLEEAFNYCSRIGILVLWIVETSTHAQRVDVHRTPKKDGEPSSKQKPRLNYFIMFIVCIINNTTLWRQQPQILLTLQLAPSVRTRVLTWLDQDNNNGGYQENEAE